ncbi:MULTISPECIES: hypothetical protein [Sporosarcina]|uniref:Uncharacterized protein n=1 Tax=Sporosarcina newyorkensis TaxID=759851 RepID=A0A1T4YKD9_9BACL|nr:hypothetical protein [Sporosarcina newyorkensis]SKB02259.1 hypothetical protein SAMN04244570_2889 [Sporosarcina newyorkensis]
MLKSKITDLVIGLIMVYFAYDRISEGQTKMGILFVVLAFLNLVAFYVKLRTEKQQQE